jgi:hypothetical protein
MIIKKSLVKIAIVPNVESIAREMTTTSQVGIILNRVKVLRLSSLVKIGLNNITYLPKIARKDFAVGIKILTELEILKLRELGKTKNIALHQQMTDMAVALNNRSVIEYLFTMSKNYDFVPYLMTENAGPLIKLLSSLRRVPSNLVIMSNGEDDEGIKRYMKISHLNFIDNKGIT